jgi:hypothetical protein
MINMIRHGIADQFLNAIFGVQLAHSIGSLSEAAAGILVLGGEVAAPGGECAPEASSGLDSTGVAGAT